MSTTKRSSESGESAEGPQVKTSKLAEDKNVVMAPVMFNTDKWIEENKKYFLPPVCNKLMHNDGQMKVFYVGGPNQRTDFHLEEGEELFYMVKGDMCLKIVEQGKHRDVIIKEGEIFLLPGNIPHSPQRFADTVGLVIERERDLDEKDGLRYFVPGKDGELTTEILYEKWFYCDDLGPRLAALVKEYFVTEQYKTGKPLPGTISDNPPLIVDTKLAVDKPFGLQKWIDTHRSKIDDKGHVALFKSGQQFQVDMYGKGENSEQNKKAETFIWQLEGSSEVTIDDNSYTLNKNDTLLVRVGQKYIAKREEGSLSLICFQDRARLTK